LTVKTTRFGEIEVAADKIITFKHGIPGFEEETEFIILPYDEDSPFFLLQSAKTDFLAFLMTDPFKFLSDYEFSIDDENMQELGIEKPEDIVIFSMVTVRGKVKDMTANLVAPVVINIKNNRARQIVLEKSPYKTQHRVFKEDA
jgi:flagellar assembly factor FliW